MNCLDQLYHRAVLTYHNRAIEMPELSDAECKKHRLHGRLGVKAAELSERYGKSFISQYRLLKGACQKDLEPSSSTLEMPIAMLWNILFGNDSGREKRTTAEQ